MHLHSEEPQASSWEALDDVELGRTREQAKCFWDEWMRAEEPFLADDQPWTRASLVVNGTPPAAMHAHTFVASGPLGG